MPTCHGRHHTSNTVFFSVEDEGEGCCGDRVQERVLGGLLINLRGGESWGSVEKREALPFSQADSIFISYGS